MHPFNDGKRFFNEWNEEFCSIGLLLTNVNVSVFVKMKSHYLPDVLRDIVKSVTSNVENSCSTEGNLILERLGHEFLGSEDAIHQKANAILIHLRNMFSGNQGIVPRHCIQCGLWLTSQEKWQLGCVICEGTWPDLRGRIGEQLMKERCALHRMWTGFRLRENVALERQVHALKYQGRRRLGLRWGQWVANSNNAPTDEAQPIALIPVPLHWRRQWDRGFNQASWIARGVAREWNAVVYPKALVRHSHANSYTGFSRQIREDLAGSAYRLGPNPPDANIPIVLVDDVLTTGTTIRACASVLESSNRKVLGALTLALA